MFIIYLQRPVHMKHCRELSLCTLTIQLNCAQPAAVQQLLVWNCIKAKSDEAVCVELTAVCNCICGAAHVEMVHCPWSHVPQEKHRSTYLQIALSVLSTH